ncbi:MAG: hypothetical protein FWD23_03995 [Oscillospiraceae bacterium]|nr:hypothetical protein [Oscillospiraceae bacterium]
MFLNDEKAILRELALQVAEIAANTRYDELRELWRGHNSLERTRVTTHIFAYLGDVGSAEGVPDNSLKCSDPFLRRIEFDLRLQLFRASFGDDQIIEPWLTVRPAYKAYGFGVSPVVEYTENGRSVHYLPSLLKCPDLSKLTPPDHIIDEETSNYQWNLLDGIFGDVLTVDRYRGPYATINAKGGDLGIMLGFDNLLTDMYDRPEYVKELISILCSGYKNIHEQAQRAGDFSLTCGDSQTMCYSRELPDPKPNSHGVKMDKLWGYLASQEMAGVSPAMTDEFSFVYDRELLKPFGLTAYGCCEDLTGKIGYLKNIPNLRRISVTPWADAAACAEQIGTDYILSWRPNPASHVSGDWDPKFIKDDVRSAMEKSRGCHVDVTLKDVLTVRGELWRLGEWVKIVNEVCSEF